MGFRVILYKTGDNTLLDDPLKYISKFIEETICLASYKVKLCII